MCTFVHLQLAKAGNLFLLHLGIVGSVISLTFLFVSTPSLFRGTFWGGSIICNVQVRRETRKTDSFRKMHILYYIRHTHYISESCVRCLLQNCKRQMCCWQGNASRNALFTLLTFFISRSRKPFLGEPAYLCVFAAVFETFCPLFSLRRVSWPRSPILWWSGT